ASSRWTKGTAWFRVVPWRRATACACDTLGRTARLWYRRKAAESTQMVGAGTEVRAENHAHVCEDRRFRCASPLVWTAVSATSPHAAEGLARVLRASRMYASNICRVTLLHGTFGPVHTLPQFLHVGGREAALAELDNDFVDDAPKLE